MASDEIVQPTDTASIPGEESSTETPSTVIEADAVATGSAESVEPVIQQESAPEDDLPVVASAPDAKVAPEAAPVSTTAPVGKKKAKAVVPEVKAETEAVPFKIRFDGTGLETVRGRRKVRTGRVESNKMQKTIVVLVETRVRHPLYGKFMRRSTRFKAHDEHNECGIGDVVEIMETRPISKDKSWRLVRIVEKAK